MIERISVELAYGNNTPPEQLVPQVLAEAKKAAPEFINHFNSTKKFPLAALLTRHSNEERDGRILNDNWDFEEDTIDIEMSPWAHYMMSNLIDLVRFLKCVSTMY